MNLKLIYYDLRRLIGYRNQYNGDETGLSNYWIIELLNTFHVIMVGAVRVYYCSVFMVE